MALVRAYFVGAFVGAGLLTGMPLIVAVPFAVADIWEPLIPFLLLRLVGPKLGIHPLGTNIATSLRKYAVFVVVAAVLPPFFSGLWGIAVLMWADFVPPDAFWYGVFSWWFGAMLLLMFLVPPICHALGNVMERRGWACHGIFS